ncbi:hypothetical protein AG4045_031140 [Apium graveolens]|uniref:C2 domain-containing protein n=1 Tax=Apium graveolens TaxID=4045 RepID=A0A6L5B812_APIGR|nr:hypothetical protein AG4045_031140 [Apium graveolens]
MGKHNHDQNKNPNQNKNNNPNQSQTQNQKFSPRPQSNPNEEFDLRETAPRLGGGRFPGNDRVGTAFDLVEQMHYLFVRVVKAKELPKKHNDHFPNSFVELQLGNFRGTTKHFENVSDPEWNQVFTILKDQIQATSIGFFVKDKDDNNNDHFIGNAELGKVVLRTKCSSSRTPLWNEDLMFVVAEPFEEPLILSLVDKQSANKDEVLGKCSVSLQNVEKRVDHKYATSIFDNQHLQGVDKGGGAKDSKLGKVRIRLSTLETDRVYTHSYPLIVLEPSGVKKLGEIQLAVRFTCTSLVNLLQMYTQPLLPIMHYIYPLSMHQIDSLRHQATQIVSIRLSRAEPPLRKEVVEYMLDVGSTMWSVRKSKANYCRIIEVMTRFTVFCRLFNQICMWKNPFITVLVHMLLLVLVYYPQMILSMMCFAIFMIGISKYRFRPRHPPHMDIKLSLAHTAYGDELDEEFDTFPTSKQGEVLKMRYDRLRCIGSRIQVVIGDLATQGERVHNLLSWRDPRATSLFLILCFISAIVLYVTPSRVIAVSMGFYILRHPRFRHKLPLTPLSFFRRLPARSDSLL